MKKKLNIKKKNSSQWELVDELPKMPQGGRTPITVTDRNDPRLQAYNDSLRLHNIGEEYKGKPIFSNEESDRITGLSSYDMEPYPMGYYKYNDTDFRARYKKPVQPVVYQPNVTRTLTTLDRRKPEQQYVYDSLGVGMKTPKRIKDLPPNAELRFTRDNGTQNWAPNPDSQYADITAYPVLQKARIKEKFEPLPNSSAYNMLAPKVEPLQLSTPNIEKGYFTREQQGQETGGKQYFDKKTGKKILKLGGKVNNMWELID